jgi:hypothetical protein
VEALRVSSLNTRARRALSVPLDLINRSRTRRSVRVTLSVHSEFPTYTLLLEALPIVSESDTSHNDLFIVPRSYVDMELFDIGVTATDFRPNLTTTAELGFSMSGSLSPRLAPGQFIQYRPLTANGTFSLTEEMYGNPVRKWEAVASRYFGQAGDGDFNEAGRGTGGRTGSGSGSGGGSGNGSKVEVGVGRWLTVMVGLGGVGWAIGSSLWL